jgi:hypothetical protein
MAAPESTMIWLRKTQTDGGRDRHDFPKPCSYGRSRPKAELGGQGDICLQTGCMGVMTII